MIQSEVIIVGGGPAGSTCAWKLKNSGMEVALLDKQDFPRSKPCAGWITPRVLKNLEIDSATYPHSFTRFNKFLIHYRGRTFTLPTRQYAIRRFDFDHWLLERAGIPIHKHSVETIFKEGGYYFLDEKYRCKFLVGAGGTSCPVYRTVFKDINPRVKELQIATLEVEFAADNRDQNCHLWFSDDDLAGYSWIVPKTNGYLNIGIGCKPISMKDKNRTLQGYWKKLIDKLMTLSLLTAHPPPPRGYTYYLRNNARTVQIENAFIIGDAVGLATLDLGEGIGPAVESGIRAAEAIIDRKSYSIEKIRKYSLWDLLLPF